MAYPPLPRVTCRSDSLRANPCPKVTDPFCRLPLSTLFHVTRGCSPWRPAAVSSTICRSAVCVFRDSRPVPPHFQGPSDTLQSRIRLTRIHPPQRGYIQSRAAKQPLPALQGPTSPTQSLPCSQIQSTEKEISFQGVCRRLRARFVPTLPSRRHTAVGSGISTGCPFGVRRLSCKRPLCAM